jgi:transketolase
MTRTMREAFAQTASELVDEDERAAVVLAEISTEYFDACAARHPDRVINVGIMEQTMVGVAAGLAMEGMHPIAHSIAPFVAERAYEQLKIDIGYQGLGGTFVGTGGSYDYASEGATHHAPADAALMLAVPRMQVLVPGHPDEVEALLRAVHGGAAPTYMRLSTATNRGTHATTLGEVKVIRPGAAALVILAFGPMLDRTLTAAEGLDATVLYAAGARPFDGAAVAAAVGDGSTLVIVEPWYEGTVAPIVLEALAGRPIGVVVIGVPRRFIHRYGTTADLDRDVGLDVGGLRARLERLTQR